MSVSREDLIGLAQTTYQESEMLDFKQEFCAERKAAFWAETIKDIVAIANTKGGIIVFGVCDDGSPSEAEFENLFSFDNAKIADQVKKYTGEDVPGIEIVGVNRGGTSFPAIVIPSVEVPLVFTTAGEYETSEKKKKIAFTVGTVYFRHGSKSEPSTRADLSAFLERRLTKIREEWLGNIRKVVEAAPGASVVVVDSSPAPGSFRITSDPNAPPVRLPNLSENFPYRQSEVIREVNARLVGKVAINTHDIQCIKFLEGISETSHPHLMSKPFKKASPQYSRDFIQLICQRYFEESAYFSRCREHWKLSNY